MPSFKELRFEGIKLKKDKHKYPWKNDKEADRVFESLVEDGSEYSMVKYKNLMQSLYDEDIHIKLSYSIVSEIIAYVLLVMVFLFGYFQLLVPSLVCFGLSIFSYLFSKYLAKKVAQLYMYKIINLRMISVLFIKE